MNQEVNHIKKRGRPQKSDSRAALAEVDAAILETLRDAVGFTQREFARQAGISQAAYSKWVNGRFRGPSIDAMLKALLLETVDGRRIDPTLDPGGWVQELLVRKKEEEKWGEQVITSWIFGTITPALHVRVSIDRLVILVRATEAQQASLRDKIASMGYSLHLEDTDKPYHYRCHIPGVGYLNLGCRFQHDQIDPTTGEVLCPHSVRFEIYRSGLAGKATGLVQLLKSAVPHAAPEISRVDIAVDYSGAEHFSPRLLSFDLKTNKASIDGPKTQHLVPFAINTCHGARRSKRYIRHYDKNLQQHDRWYKRKCRTCAVLVSHYCPQCTPLYPPPAPPYIHRCEAELRPPAGADRSLEGFMTRLNNPFQEHYLLDLSRVMAPHLRLLYLWGRRVGLKKVFRQVRKRGSSQCASKRIYDGLVHGFLQLVRQDPLPQPQVAFEHHRAHLQAVLNALWGLPQ